MGKDLTVEFRQGGNSTEYKGTGWSDPENDGTWMLGQQSLVVLPRPDTSGDYRLDLDVAPIVGPDHPSQRLSVSVNGMVMAEFVLLDNAIEHCLLPWSVIGREPGLTFVLSHPDAWRPSDLTGGEGDQRELSVFLRSARLSLHEAAPANGLDAAAPLALSPVRPIPTSSAAVASPPVASPITTPKASTPSVQIPTPPAAPTHTTSASPASRPATPASVQEERMPWWKKLLG